MKHAKAIMTTASTLVIAAGIGLVMQDSNTAHELYGRSNAGTSGAGASSLDPSSNTSAGADVLIEVQKIQLTSANEVNSPTIGVSGTDVTRVSAPDSTIAPEPDSLPTDASCDATLTATPTGGAFVNLLFNAPCAPNERLTVHHNGMMFSQVTDTAGSLFTTVPALTEQAVFIVAFSNGDGAVAQTTVPDMDQYDRVALQWQGQSGLELHAREFGAAYGQPGHYWSGGSQNLEGLAQGENGMVIRLGNARIDEPLVAEVYTFPIAKANREGVVDLSVEAEVTDKNCGQEIDAQSLETMAGGQMKTQNLTLFVPDCEAIGSFLVLNNLVSDLKVSSN